LPENALTSRKFSQKLFLNKYFKGKHLKSTRVKKLEVSTVLFISKLIYGLNLYVDFKPRETPAGLIEHPVNPKK